MLMISSFCVELYTSVSFRGDLNFIIAEFGSVGNFSGFGFICRSRDIDMISFGLDSVFCRDGERELCFDSNLECILLS
jgi:hypothetical protein